MLMQRSAMSSCLNGTGQFSEHKFDVILLTYTVRKQENQFWQRIIDLKHLGQKNGTLSVDNGCETNVDNTSVYNLYARKEHIYN